jgi:hypothetical protein
MSNNEDSTTDQQSNNNNKPKVQLRIPGRHHVSDLLTSDNAGKFTEKTILVDDDAAPLIASTQQQEDVNNEPKSTNYISKSKLPASFEDMKRVGFKFTSFESS